MKTLVKLTLCGLVLLCWAGCDRAPEPVANLRLEPAQIELPYPGYTSLQLHWDVQAALEGGSGDPLVFVHLLDAEGNVERTYDHDLPFDWQAGTSHSYDITLYQSALAPPLDTGEYRLSVGLYAADGQRWALSGAGEEVANLEYHLATVDTAGDPAAVPMFYFSPSWLPLEAGTDVQILGRRWLTDEGTIRVAEIPTTGTVWMQLQVSRPQEGVEELSLAEGEAGPAVGMSSTCGGEEISVSGFGVHEMEVRVQADDSGTLPEECEIVLRPNYQVIDVNTLARRSVGLRILSWRAE